MQHTNRICMALGPLQVQGARFSSGAAEHQSLAWEETGALTGHKRVGVQEKVPINQCTIGWSHEKRGGGGREIHASSRARFTPRFGSSTAAMAWLSATGRMTRSVPCDSRSIRDQN
jgi:hypothetical protein